MSGKWSLPPFWELRLASVCQGVLNSCSVFWVSALTPVLLNVCIIASALSLASLFENPAYGFATGVIIGGILQLFIHFPLLRKRGMRFFSRGASEHAQVRKALLLLLPTAFGSGIYHINLVVGNIIASTLGEGAVSSLKFSSRLLEFITGVIVISLTTVILPRFSNLFLDRQTTVVKSNLEDTIQILAFITFPVIIGVFFVHREIISLLFERGRFNADSVMQTSSVLVYHAGGLLFIAWNRVLLTCYQASTQVRRMVHIGVFIIVFNGILALLLSRWMEANGIALSMAVCQLLQTVLLVFFLGELSISKPFDLFLDRSFIITLLSGLVMACSLYLTKHYFIPADTGCAVTLLLLMLTGVLVYPTVNVILRNNCLERIVQRMKTRRSEQRF